MRIAYLVHDVNDAAVARRVDVFAHAGLPVTMAGFRRRDTVPATVGHAPVIDLGLTRDGRLKERALAVLRHRFLPGRVRQATRDADVIVARQLEELVLAQAVRRPGQRLVYELLDVHRMLLEDGAAARALQAVETRALRGVDLAIVSSPHFADDYLRARRGYAGEILLVENKVPALDGAAPRPGPRSPSGKPWTIGWFGMLRCRRSLDMLAQIARAGAGRVDVLIAGRASDTVFGTDFAAAVAGLPHVRYAGPYTAADLPALYARTDFAWAIDYMEEGLNSRWLLPNRLYEGLAHGAVPVALGSVATGEWLAARGVGVTVGDPVADLKSLFARLTTGDYDSLHDKVRALPPQAVVMTGDEARAIAARVTGRPA